MAFLYKKSVLFEFMFFPDEMSPLFRKKNFVTQERKLW